MGRLQVGELPGKEDIAWRLQVTLAPDTARLHCTRCLVTRIYAGVYRCARRLERRVYTVPVAWERGFSLASIGVHGAWNGTSTLYPLPRKDDIAWRLQVLRGGKISVSILYPLPGNDQ